MTWKRLMVSTVSLLLSTGPGSTQSEQEVEARLSSTYRRCMDRAEGVTANMLDCIGAEHRRQDAVLNATYKRAISSQDAAGKAELRTLQRAWIKAKDARCSSEAADAGGGTLSTVVDADCRLMRTTERVLWLEQRY